MVGLLGICYLCLLFMPYLVAMPWKRTAGFSSHASSVSQMKAHTDADRLQAGWELRLKPHFTPARAD